MQNLFSLILDMDWWQKIIDYYAMIGEKYNVDPIIFVGIHVVATPLFAGAVWWIIYNKKKKRSILLPSLLAIFIFNAASIYLIILGRDIPFYIYAIVGVSAAFSGYFTFRKIKRRIAEVK